MTMTRQGHTARPQTITEQHTRRLWAFSVGSCLLSFVVVGRRSKWFSGERVDLRASRKAATFLAQPLSAIAHLFRPKQDRDAILTRWAGENVEQETC